MVWRSPCHSWRTPWTGTLGLAWCCKGWICCWRCGPPQCATVFYWSPSSTPSSAACHRVFHLEMGSMKRSLCPAHFRQPPQDPAAWAHLEVKHSYLCIILLKNHDSIDNLVKYGIWSKFTCDSNFNAKGFLANYVFDDDGVDPCVWAFSWRNQELGSSFSVADGHLFGDLPSIFLPYDFRPRRSLTRIYTLFKNDITCITG